MATPAIVLLSKRMHRSGQMGRFRYSIPSVLPNSTSPRYSLQVQTAVGTLAQVKFVMENNVLVDLFFGSADVAYRGTLDEVHQWRSVSQGCPTDTKICAIYDNVELTTDGECGVAQLYLEIDNSSIASATGAITMELIVQEGAYL